MHGNNKPEERRDKESREETSHKVAWAAVKHNIQTFHV